MDKRYLKNTILFLASQTISLFGSSLVQYAIVWHITMKTQSGIMMAISIICGFLPSFFLSPFAGVWADRFNRKMLIVLADTAIAVATLILAVLFIMGYNMMWLLFAIMAIRSLGTAVQTPAVSAFIPQIVPEDKLTKINGLNGSIQSLVMLISPMISGALLSIATIEKLFFIDVITAAIAVFIMLVFLKVQPHSKALGKQDISYFDDLKLGINYIMNHDFIKTFFLFGLFFFILVSPAAFLTALQVTRTFGNDVWHLTVVEVAFSSGMTIGGILIASWGGFKNKLHSLVVSTVVMGFCTILLGIIPNFILYLIPLVLTGISIPLFNTPSMVLLQEKVEENYLGRVFGVMTMISSLTMPVSMLVFGPMADFIKIEWLFIGTGILLVIQGFFMLKNKVLHEAGKPQTE